MKKYDKEITTAQQKELYTKYQQLSEELSATKKQERQSLLIYFCMEGKYALGTADTMAGQGIRSYGYKYSNKEELIKERTEREAYYKENVEPFSQRIADLQKQLFEVDEALCVALWGYGTEVYYKKQQLAEAEEDVAFHQMRVETLRKEIEELTKKS